MSKKIEKKNEEERERERERESEGMRQRERRESNYGRFVTYLIRDNKERKICYYYCVT